MSGDLRELQTQVKRVIEASEAVGCRVIATATQSIANNSPVALAFDQVIADTGGSWDAGSPTQLRAPSDGYYQAGGSWSLAAAQNTAASRVFIGVRRNGTQYVGAAEVHSIAGKFVEACCATGFFWLDAGDYIELVAYHDEGVSKTASAADNNNQHLCLGWLMRTA